MSFLYQSPPVCTLVGLENLFLTVVASVEIKLGVDPYTTELAEEVCDKWDWVLILPGESC